jgi:hypothetical protein
MTNWHYQVPKNRIAANAQPLVLCINMSSIVFNGRLRPYKEDPILLQGNSGHFISQQFTHSVGHPMQIDYDYNRFLLSLGYPMDKAIVYKVKSTNFETLVARPKM